MPITEKTEDVLKVNIEEGIAIVGINREHKRNALSDHLMKALLDFFSDVPEEVKAVVLYGIGENFCAGLDLNEIRERNTTESMFHSRMWHKTFEQIQFGRVPVISVLHGAVIGGGLELAAATHIRVAEDTAYYGLPEGQRGLFVGGGGSVRISRLIGVACMTDMMLAGRILTAEEGHSAGISQYAVGKGDGLQKARELAQRVARNAPMTNYGVMHVLPRIYDQSIQDGLVTESLMAAIASSDPNTKELLSAFLDKKMYKVK